MGILWKTSHGMGWDRHKLLWDGNGTDKYVPWTTLRFTIALGRLGSILRCFLIPLLKIRGSGNLHGSLKCLGILTASQPCIA